MKRNQDIQSQNNRNRQRLYRFNSVDKEITDKVPIVSPHDTISSVIKLIHVFATTCESITYFYVLDKNNKLHGVVSLKELLKNEKKELIKDIMTKDLVVSHVQVNRKRVAHLAIKHRIKAVPVLDENEKFVGVLSSDKMLAILYEEHRNELYRSSGIFSLSGTFDTILEQGILRAFLARIPWIVVGLLGGIFAAQIIEFFEHTLTHNLILAAFIPLIVYISDAVGTQTQTFFVRDIAFNPRLQVFQYFIKQFITTTLIGLICWLLVSVLVILFWQTSYLGLVIGLATFTAITSSTIVAILIPYLLNIFKQDPANGSGPFATIIQDLLSIFVYFLIATILL